MAHNPISFTVSTQLITPNCEALCFNDHVELEDPMCNFEEDSTRPHFSYSLDEARTLRTFFNRPDVVHVLEQ